MTNLLEITIVGWYVCTSGMFVSIDVSVYVNKESVYLFPLF